MIVAGRQKSIAFFIALGAGLICVIITLYVGWVLLNWRHGILLVLGALLMTVSFAYQKYWLSLREKTAEEELAEQQDAGNVDQRQDQQWNIEAER